MCITKSDDNPSPEHWLSLQHRVAARTRAQDAIERRLRRDTRLFFALVTLGIVLFVVVATSG